MTDTRSNSFLTIIYIISIVILASLILGFGSLVIIFLIAGIVFLVNPSARMGILRDTLSGMSNTSGPWSIMFSIFFILFLLAMLILIAWSVLKLIQNVREKKSFLKQVPSAIFAVFSGDMESSSFGILLPLLLPTDSA